MSQGPPTTRTLWLPFALCIALTAAATIFVNYAERQAERAALAHAVSSARHRVVERMESYVSMLRGAAGLLARSEPVTAEEFQRFVGRLRLGEHYPGTLGIGYSARFGAVAAAEATMRARDAGWTGIRVWPETPRDEVHAIVLLEPFDERNRVAMGYDMRTEPTRRDAMDRARDDGDVALSGKVTLVQEIEEGKQAGFLLYSPVYAGGVVPVALDERRARLRGYVYAPLRAGDLVEGIFGGERPSVAFELYDGEVVDDRSLLHALGRRIEPAEDVVVERLAVAGRVWTARFVREDIGPGALSLALVVAVLGIFLSAVVLVVTRERDRARTREIHATAAALASQEVLRWNDTFIGILGHDLRTPLQAVALGSELLLRKVEGQGEMVRPLERIRASGQRMARMIEQLLDLTRARLGGGIRVHPRPAELGALVRDVVDELAPAGAEPCIVLHTLGELAGTWDADRLAQVFSNLLGNAVRHRLDAPVRVVLDGRAPDRVVAEVRNAGVIPLALLPAVFEPFRGEARPQGGPSGLGLGLYITRAIVEAHGGSVTATSDAGGTTLTVTLPRDATAAAGSGAPRSS